MTSQFATPLARAKVGYLFAHDTQTRAMSFAMASHRHGISQVAPIAFVAFLAATASAGRSPLI